MKLLLKEIKIILPESTLLPHNTNIPVGIEIISYILKNIILTHCI